MRAADGGQCFEHGVLGDAVRQEDPGRVAFSHLEHGQEEVLGRDILVLELVSLLPGRVEDPPQVRRKDGLPSPADLGQAFEGCVDIGLDLRRRRAHLGQDGIDDVLVPGEKTPEEMFGTHLLMAHLLGPSLGLLNGLLGHHRELIPAHRTHLPKGLSLLLKTRGAGLSRRRAVKPHLGDLPP